MVDRFIALRVFFVHDLERTTISGHHRLGFAVRYGNVCLHSAFTSTDTQAAESMPFPGGVALLHIYENAAALSRWDDDDSHATIPSSERPVSPPTRTLFA